jgi:septal ring factor EnvC (AmiA/AmiB activator)
MKPNRHDDDDNVLSWEQQKILREIAALRAEVASLHKEIMQMRATAVEDTIDVIVRALQQLPARVRNRERGFRKLPSIGDR